MASTVVLISVYLDLGTEYLSSIEVNHPTRIYEGRVTAYGTIERSIPIPVGLPSVGNLTITWADTDHVWRQKLALRTPLRRLIQVKIGEEGASEVAFPIAYTGEIRAVHFDQESVSVEAADITGRWFDNPIPSLINKTNFPNSAVDDAFWPIIFGEVIDTRPAPQGAIRLHLIDSALNQYAVARTPIVGVQTVYKKQLAADFTPSRTQDAFVVVDPADYITEELTQTIDGVEYTLTVITFAAPLDTGSPLTYGGVEVRADVIGTNFRGGFGTMVGVSGNLRNPIDHLINMLYYAALSEPDIAHYNYDSFQTVRDQLNTLGWFCDGAMVDPLTMREFLGQFLTCFNLDLIQNRSAELEVKLTTAEDTSRPVFTDLDDILLGSVKQDLPSPTFNRIAYRYGRLYADGLWGAADVYDNAADQAELTLPFATEPKIQVETVELNFIREDTTAAAVIFHRGGYEDLSSYRLTCDLPAPEVLDLVELGTLVGITHAGGIREGGWVNEEFKVYRESLNLDDLRLTISGIRRASGYDTLTIITECPLPDGVVEE